jgi:hypothetical protein
MEKETGERLASIQERSKALLVIEYQTPPSRADRPSRVSCVLFGGIAALFTGLFTLLALASLAASGSNADLLAPAGFFGFLAWICGVVTWSYFAPGSEQTMQQ